MLKFHWAGLTLEAPRLADVGGDRLPSAHRVGESGVAALRDSYASASDGKFDVAVLSAPQPSLPELRSLSQLCEGRSFKVSMLAVTGAQVKPDTDLSGYTGRIEAAGGTVLSDMCFHQSYACEIAEAKGWRRLATNSAKLVNILDGYGHTPMLASTETCVDAAAEAGALQ